MKKGPKDNSPSESFTNTRVDLGDDLIERTIALTRESEPAQSVEPDDAAPMIPSQIEDKLQSAKILLSEGFTEEAKKILRKILILNSSHVVARQALSEIHEVELKQIFGEDRKRRPKRRHDGPESVLSDLDAEEIMRELDRDLKLGIFTEDHGLSAESKNLPSSLFQDPEALEMYADRLDQDLADLSGQDRMDLGIAFHVMGLHELAMRQFRAACHVYMQKPEENAQAILAATGLTAYALILVGRPYEATMMIQAILRDSEIKHDHKLEFFYLMGRAYEMMRKPDLAALWYEQVRKVDPRYRDVEGRLRGKRGG